MWLVVYTLPWGSALTPYLQVEIPCQEAQDPDAQGGVQTKGPELSDEGTETMVNSLKKIGTTDWDR